MMIKHKRFRNVSQMGKQPVSHAQKITRILGVAFCASLVMIGLSGCNTLSRLSKVGEEPQLSQISNPQHQDSYKQISMPMPTPLVATENTNSLWRAGSRSFFKDQRASQVGDIVTVVIEIDDQADMQNSTSRNRAATEDSGVGGLLGYESSLNAILPEAINPESLFSTDSASQSSGGGTIARQEQIDLRVAAVVTQILPNGNLVIHGRQETKVNYEVRELQVTGVIRPQDISNQNTIDYNKIAEGRLAYGGRGHISDMQSPRWGNQLIDVISPF